MSELFVSETFVLKKAPNATASFDYNGNWGCCSDPMWFICKGCEMGRPIRFKAVSRYPDDTLVWDTASVAWKRVLCLEQIATSRWVNRMNWEVKFTANLNIKRVTKGYSKRRVVIDRPKQEFLNSNVRVIRLRMYWVLRGIVTLKRMLERARVRRMKRKLFIRATYWGHPECKFSRFSGTINTPVKQRIYAYI